MKLKETTMKSLPLCALALTALACTTTPEPTPDPEPKEVAAPETPEPATDPGPVPEPVPVSPDSPLTAKAAPKAEDLARYISDMPGPGTLYATLKIKGMGEFKCELYEKDAPMTVANFVGLARGLKAWVDRAEFSERSDQQSRAHQQHHRKSDL